MNRSEDFLRVAAVQFRRISDDDRPDPDEDRPVRELARFIERDMEVGR